MPEHIHNRPKLHGHHSPGGRCNSPSNSTNGRSSHTNTANDTHAIYIMRPAKPQLAAASGSVTRSVGQSSQQVLVLYTLNPEPAAGAAAAGKALLLTACSSHCWCSSLATHCQSSAVAANSCAARCVCCMSWYSIAQSHAAMPGIEAKAPPCCSHAPLH